MSAKDKEMNVAKRAEYKIVIGKGGFKDLESQVNSMMNKGWKPVGGVAFNSNFPHQAMARIVEIEQTQKQAKETEERSTKKEPMNTADAMRMLENGI
jgi:hypothetical protein